MPPKTILLMRHAEKPDDIRDPNLSPRGMQRAKDLAKFIPEKWNDVDFIFASAITKHSARPYETVRPLSITVSIPIDATTADQDYEVLADELLQNEKYHGALVVICWHHGFLPSFALSLGAAPKSIPNPWEPKVFDLIIQIDRGDGAPVVKQVQEKFQTPVNAS